MARFMIDTERRAYRRPPAWTLSIIVAIGVGWMFTSCRNANVTSQQDDRGQTPAAESGAGTPTTPYDPTDPNAPRGDTSFMPVDFEDFTTLFDKLSGEEPDVMSRQNELLTGRYDLSDHTRGGVTMFRGKGIQSGVRTRLPDGQTWDSLASLTPEQIKEQAIFPEGFKPLPHALTEQGGQVFPQVQIDEIKNQTGRDLKRFDVEFDIPEWFTPEFPPPIFLTSRPDLGDVSQGQLVTHQNFWKLFSGILTPKQMDGMRLLVTPFAQQQFNLTFDRRSADPSLGVTCFDCHANGHTNAAFHLDPQTRPQESRRRIETPSLRGVNIQRLLGSQRALKSVEDFTEFEQRGAYFDGDQVIATKKGLHILDRGSEVANMAEMQNILDFPPAPKLLVNGHLNPTLASAQELRGEELFFGKADCASCHTPPFYTDNEMHDLQEGRFFKPAYINGRYVTGVGAIKTFPLRGIKESPPYLHDGRLLTLDDTVEYFNLVLQLKLTQAEKEDLVAFMLVL